MYKQSAKHTILLLTIPTLLLSAPDAGSILNNIQTDTKKQSEQYKKPAIVDKNRSKEENATQIPSSKINVNRFEVSGVTILNSKELGAFLNKNSGKQMTFDEIDKVVLSVTEYYKQRGFLASAFLPPQSVKDGIIQIGVIEGILSDIEVTSQNNSRVDTNFVKSILASSHKIGKPFEFNKVEKALLILQDMPGISQSSSLSAGQTQGDTKLNVNVSDTALLDSMINYTNNGSKSTGEHQLTANANINNPGGKGDQLSITAMGSEGVVYARTSYTSFVGYSGLRMGLNASAMRYYLVGDTFATLKSKGTATTAGITSSYPISKSQQGSLTLNSSIDFKRYVNMANESVTSHKKITSANIGVSASRYDENAVTYANILLTTGRAGLRENISDFDNDASTANTEGSYSKLNLSLQRQQLLIQDLALTATFQAQIANKNLDSSEKMYLGGMYAVRAYPTNEAGGDMGWLASIGVKYSITQKWNVTPFLDSGRILQHHSVWSGANNGSPNSYNLYGTGIELGYVDDTAKLYAKLTASCRLGDNPAKTSGGDDNDGTKYNPRIWASLSKSF
ncbi:MAG: ShlB/FhaC/HecB family hemolysin secretion/activation protein [Campylobacterales bacterium]|nr:ShlB/FhaC/HecB family hemolysin secretion/activation protein [Campylobacterales bacterium]